MEDKLEKHLEEHLKEFQKITTELTSASKYEMDLYLAIFRSAYFRGVSDCKKEMLAKSK